MRSLQAARNPNLISKPLSWGGSEFVTVNIRPKVSPIIRVQYSKISTKIENSGVSRVNKKAQARNLLDYFNLKMMLAYIRDILSDTSKGLTSVYALVKMGNSECRNGYINHFTICRIYCNRTNNSQRKTLSSFSWVVSDNKFPKTSLGVRNGRSENLRLASAT